MRILIIGGTGIISTGITRLLLERGDEVVLYNRGQRPSQVEGNYTTITGDRKDFARFEGQMQEAGTFDCVIDMVCYLPEEAASAVRAFKGRTAHYIFCSTVDVYTKPAAAYPITEAAERQPSPAVHVRLPQSAMRNCSLPPMIGGVGPPASGRGTPYGEGGNNLIHALGGGKTITWIACGRGNRSSSTATAPPLAHLSPRRCSGGLFGAIGNESQGTWLSRGRRRMDDLAGLPSRLAAAIGARNRTWSVFPPTC
ncbi:MAG: hypothetical protein R2932_16215 [Caldilineaceae bacterium]